MGKRVGGVWAVLVLAGLVGPVPADDNGLQAVVDKAVKAAGGADPVAKLQTMTMKTKGSTLEGGQTINFSLDCSLQGTDRARLEATIDAMGMIKNGTLILNGKQAWAKDEAKVQDLPEMVAAAMVEVIYVHRFAQAPTLLKDKAFTLDALGEIKIEDRPAVGIKVSHKEHRDLNLFFDKETGLPLKSEIRVTGPDGQELTFATTYRDYKEFAGVKHFTKMTLKAGDMATVEFEVSEVKPHEKFDDTVFARP